MTLEMKYTRVLSKWIEHHTRVDSNLTNDQTDNILPHMILHSLASSLSNLAEQKEKCESWCVRVLLRFHQWCHPARSEANASDDEHLSNRTHFTHGQQKSQISLQTQRESWTGSARGLCRRRHGCFFFRLAADAWGWMLLGFYGRGARSGGGGIPGRARWALGPWRPARWLWRTSRAAVCVVRPPWRFILGPSALMSSSRVWWSKTSRLQLYAAHRHTHSFKKSLLKLKWTRT